LKQTKEVNQLAAAVAEGTADMDNKKETNKKKADQKIKASKEKKASITAEEAAVRAVELPKLAPLMLDF